MIVALIVLALGATTYGALESGGVVVITTQRADGGGARGTRIWYVTQADRVLLEAGDPRNPWVADLNTAESLRFTGEGLDGEYRFKLHDRSSHEIIRKHMRKKYGWRDWWISLVFDTSNSFLVEVSLYQN